MSERQREAPAPTVLAGDRDSKSAQQTDEDGGLAYRQVFVREEVTDEEGDSGADGRQ